MNNEVCCFCTKMPESLHKEEVAKLDQMGERVPIISVNE